MISYSTLKTHNSNQCSSCLSHFKNYILCCILPSLFLAYNSSFPTFRNWIFRKIQNLSLDNRVHLLFLPNFSHHLNATNSIFRFNAKRIFISFETNCISFLTHVEEHQTVPWTGFTPFPVPKVCLILTIFAVFWVWNWNCPHQNVQKSKNAKEQYPVFFCQTCSVLPKWTEI